VAPLWIALIFVAAVSGLCMFFDGMAKRKRKGLSDLDGSRSKTDPVANVDRIDPGTAARAEGWGQSSDNHI
jgi:hypothetical protein